MFQPEGKQLTGAAANNQFHYQLIIWTLKTSVRTYFKMSRRRPLMSCLARPTVKNRRYSVYWGRKQKSRKSETPRSWNLRVIVVSRFNIENSCWFFWRTVNESMKCFSPTTYSVPPETSDLTQLQTNKHRSTENTKKILTNELSSPLGQLLCVHNTSRS